MAAAEVDVRLIDPTPAAFAAALKRAHAAANRGVGYERASERLARGAGFWDRFVRDCLREPAGRRRSCRAGAQSPEVVAGWWTDPAGRRHVRVLGRTRHRYPRGPGLRSEGELRDLPPWWHVYPEAVLAVRRGAGEEYLACCRCGAVGSPASLGWMGDTCGPCFDRAADGGVPAGGFGHFGGWRAGVVGFSPDGGRLIGADLGLKWRSVSRHDRTAVGWKTVAGTVAAVGGGPGGTVVARGDGTVYRWSGAGPPARVVPWPRAHGRALLSADGARAVVLAAGAGYTADLTAARPRYARGGAERAYFAAEFTPDGRRVVGLAPGGELIALDPATLSETVVRADVFDGLSRYGYAHDLAVSPDGSAVAVVRETFSRATTTVRVLPLAGAGRPTDLPLPPDHRPSAAAFAPDGAHLVTTDARAGWVGIWRLASRKAVGFVRAVPEDPGWRGGRAGFSRDGAAVAVLYCGGHQGRGSTVVVWPWPEVLRAAGSEERG